MLKLFVLSAALFSFSLIAAAQDTTASSSAGSAASEPAAPAPFAPASRDAWQVGVGFQYLHFDVLGTSFSNYGYQADVARYLNNWFAVEGTAIVGFGNAGSNPTLTAKSLFLGGGPHISLHNTVHFEPWVHVLGGWERFRFTQTAVLGVNSNAAFIAGGGLDYKIHGGRLYWRVQGDYIGTNVGSGLSTNYAIGTGLLLNF